MNWHRDWHEDPELPSDLREALSDARRCETDAGQLDRLAMRLAPLLATPAAAASGIEGLREAVAGTKTGGGATSAAGSGATGTAAGATGSSLVGVSGVALGSAAKVVLSLSLAAVAAVGAQRVMTDADSERPSGRPAVEAAAPAATPPLQRELPVVQRDPASPPALDAQTPEPGPNGEQPAMATAPKPDTERTQPPPTPAAPPEARKPTPPALQEARLLARARPLVEHDPAAALRLLERHARRHPSGLLAQEREVLAIDALLALKRYAPARTRARRFIRRYPDSPHAARWPGLSP